MTPAGDCPHLTRLFPPQANLYVALMIMCGFVLFDTQLIIEKAESGDKDYIWWVLGTWGGDTEGGVAPSEHPSIPPSPRHCVDLFLDFVNIFRELLMILGMSEVGEGPCAGQGGRAAPWRGGQRGRAHSDRGHFALAEQEEGEEVKQL